MILEGHAYIERTSIPFKFTGDPDKTLAENLQSWQEFALGTIMVSLAADPNWLTISIEFDGVTK